MLVAGDLYGYFCLAGGFPAVEEGVREGVRGEVFVACEGGVGALGVYFSCGGGGGVSWLVI